jgi:hypothetical protein
MNPQVDLVMAINSHMQRKQIRLGGERGPDGTMIQTGVQESGPRLIVIPYLG